MKTLLEILEARQMCLKDRYSTSGDSVYFFRAEGIGEAIKIIKGLEKLEKTETPPPQPKERKARPARIPEVHEIVPGKLYSTSEVAELFAVTQRSVINWVRSGVVPNTRTLGGHIRIKGSDLLESERIRRERSKG